MMNIVNAGRALRVLSASALSLTVIGLSISGCATPSYNYQPEIRQISEPPLESINTATVGDSLLKQGHFQERDAIKLSKLVSIGVLGNYKFTPGYYIKVGGNNSAGFYNEGSFADSGHVLRNPLADPFQVIEVHSDGLTICGVTVFNLKVCTQTDGLTFTKIPLGGPDSFQQTLIYSGKVGSKINIGYREFSGSMARPAFDNNVEYDLSESKIIGYKGARLEIIEATNDHIKYRVIQNFNAAMH